MFWGHSPRQEGLSVSVPLAYLAAYVAASAYPAGRVRSALPTDESAEAALRRAVAARDHHGFRVIARKDGARVRLYSRPGNDLTDRFSLIVEALAGLRSRPCEAVRREAEEDWGK